MLERLAPKGRIVIVAYYGHEGGAEELLTVRNYCEQLPQELYNVLNYQFINQKNQPPILFCIEKNNESTGSPALHIHTLTNSVDNKFPSDHFPVEALIEI